MGMNMVKKKVFSGSWKTTTAGICCALSILFGEVSNLLDGKPETFVNIEQVFVGVSMLMMGLTARDNDVSSKKAGADQ